MISFNKLAIASAFKCVDCDQFKELYLDQIYLTKLGFIEENKLFETILLEDFKEHIEDKHLDRFKAFIEGVKND